MARRRVGLWLLVALAVAAQCWIYRDVMTPGGLSSIAVGEAIIRANWREAVNGWWSPLYGLLIGLVTEMFRPSAAVEFGFVRFTDFLIFAATIPCFEFFLRNLIRFNRYRGNYERGELFRPIPVWVFYFIGFPLFAIASIGWISVVHHPAAIAVAGALYIVFGVLLRVHMRNAKTWDYVWMGLALGVAYLADQCTIVVALLPMLIAVISLRRFRRRKRFVLISLLMFLVAVAPYVTALSLVRHRFCVSERLPWRYTTYLTDKPLPMNAVRRYPVTKLAEVPGTSYQRFPQVATIPMLYDPGDGAGRPLPGISWTRVGTTMKDSTRALTGAFLQMSWLLVPALIFLARNRGRRTTWRAVSGHWPLWAFPVLAALAYFPFHPQLWEAAPYMVAILLGLLSCVEPPLRPSTAGWRAGSIVFTLAVFAGLAILVLPSLPNRYARVTRELRDAEQQRVIAESVRKSEIRGGDDLALVGEPSTAVWARIARVRIVAKISPSAFSIAPGADSILNPDGTLKPNVRQAMADAGICGIVAGNPPEKVTKHGWYRLGQTGLWALTIVPNPR